MMQRSMQCGLRYSVSAMKRHQREDEILLVKARKKKKAASDEQFDADSLVIGVTSGGCIVAGDEEPGLTRLCHTKISVVLRRLVGSDSP